MTKARFSATASLLLALCAAASAAGLTIDLRNEAALPQQRLDALLPQFKTWAQRVFDFHHATPSAPVKLVLTRRVHVGLYVDDVLYLPPDEDGEMLETWIHELTHHVLGHESSFFFKEGSASYTLEALFAREHRIPDGWPNYGASCDDWARLFDARGQWPALRTALDWPAYQGDTPENDFRSWQIYLLGCSFSGWTIREQGYAAFHAAYEKAAPSGAVEDVERRWLRNLRTANTPLIKPEALLPARPRYQGFARRLAASPAGK